jgi:hypothetical protein
MRSGDFSPDQFGFTVTRNGLILAQFEGVDDPPRNCVDVTISPGEYTVSEVGPVPDLIKSGTECGLPIFNELIIC